MALSEADIERYCTAIRWAQIPENREHLPSELRFFVELIEAKITELKETEDAHKSNHKFTLSLNCVALTLPTYTTGVFYEKTQA